MKYEFKAADGRMIDCVSANDGTWECEWREPTTASHHADNKPRGELRTHVHFAEDTMKRTRLTNLDEFDPPNPYTADLKKLRREHNIPEPTPVTVPIEKFDQPRVPTRYVPTPADDGPDPYQQALSELRGRR